MKYIQIVLSVLILSVATPISAESLFDRIKKKADEIIAKQEAKADQKIDKTIDDTVDSAEEAVYEGGETTTSSTGTGASTSQTAVTGDNGNPMLVKMTQTELKRLGYPVSVDGVYGTGTRNAILAYEAENGRQLTGNVSPDLVNALKSTTTSGSAGKAAGSTAQTATVQSAAGTQYGSKSVSNSNTGGAGKGQAQRFWDECLNARKSWGATPSLQQKIDLCVRSCSSAAQREKMKGGIPADLLNSCVSRHEAVLAEHASTKSAQQLAAQNATTVAAATEASHGALAPYINELRALAAECQSIPGDDKNVRTCAANCKKLADKFMAYNKDKISEGLIRLASHRLDQCKQFHKWAMDSQ